MEVFAAVDEGELWVVGGGVGGRCGQPVDQRARVAVADGGRRVGAGGAAVASGCIWRRTARLI